THLVMTATSTNSPSPKRKKRNEDGVAFSSDMQAATSASTVERTIVVARDAIQSIMLGSARSVAPSFRNIKDMSVAKLMTEIVTQGINISQKNCFGDDIGPKMKLRAKRVFEIALSFVPENDNKYFDVARFPREGVERDDLIVRVLPPIAAKAMNDLIADFTRRKEILESRPKGTKSPKQGTNVGAVGGLIERVQALERKQDVQPHVV
ncbi:MAG: hypothetical protein ACREOZ_04450, partial [Gloeomargaritales cyanobacterium]